MSSEKRRDDAARAWGSYFDDGHMKKNGVFNKSFVVIELSISLCF